MRACVLLFLAALLAAPLLAGPDSPLVTAVRLFKSGAPGEREQGSRVADRELRKVLKPLLDAMKDADPEVRRRARQSILALVPYHDREPETKGERDARFVLAQAAAVQQVRVRLLPGKRLVAPGWRPANVQKAQDAVLRELLRKNAADNVKGQVAQKALGLAGAFTKVGKNKGFKVQAVTKGSPAAKAGVRAGDLVLALNGRALKTHADFRAAIDPRRGWSGAKLMLVRGAAALTIVVP
ncbi:MAG: PDZ domain-containing protein [Planctomycetota bacterium]|jgi:hypothetical protein